MTQKWRQWGWMARSLKLSNQDQGYYYGEWNLAEILGKLTNFFSSAEVSEKLKYFWKEAFLKIWAWHQYLCTSQMEHHAKWTPGPIWRNVSFCLHLTRMWFQFIITLNTENVTITTKFSCKFVICNKLFYFKWISPKLSKCFILGN